MKSVLKYPGAKNRLANWICSFIPDHEVYCEPFFGSGAVFFNKPKAKIETVNDLDGNVVNYFHVIREHPAELARLLSLTPFSRDEYEQAFLDNPNDSDIERARKFAVRCWMGFSCGNRYKNGFRSSQQRNSPRTTKIWRDLPEIIQLAADRLLDAQIENLPAIELIQRYNTPDVLLYVDPPYLGSTRKKYLYPNEMMEEKEHRALLELLVKHPGKIIISGYDCPLYNEILKGWHKEFHNNQVEQGITRMETLWMNYEYGQLQLEL